MFLALFFPESFQEQLLHLQQVLALFLLSFLLLAAVALLLLLRPRLFSPDITFLLCCKGTFLEAAAAAAEAARDETAFSTNARRPPYLSPPFLFPRGVRAAFMLRKDVGTWWREKLSP